LTLESLAFGCSPGCAASAGISLLFFQGLCGRHARRFALFREGKVMQVIYERCAAVDVGKDVIAVAVRKPGDGPDGRVTVKRQYKTFYGVLREAARWLVSEGVTHVAMEATGIYSMPSTTRWSSTATSRRSWCATPAM
jgi:hypothetical protein